MRISLEWLHDFIDVLDIPPERLAARLTSGGFEATPLGALFSGQGIVVGRVLDVRPHPNADRLSVCSVTVGDEGPLTILCGAPNVAPGQKLVVAKAGADLVKGRVEERKIRGVVSQGMICAEDEVGFGEDHTGIIVLPNDAPVGQPVMRYLHLDGERIELELTANRPDGMSHIGVAREVAALFDRPVRLPTFALLEEGAPIETVASVTIDDPVGCPRYVARVIEGVKVGPSPAWMAGRLQQVGLRPINNVVDATNYVLMALGHPLHAFDLDRLDGRRIVVRAAGQDEPFTTLDGLERRVPAGGVLICDATRPVALGGIMGGLNSEITDETTNILLEAAYFLPTRIRRTAKAVDLQTEASMRFERGADYEMVIRAIDWAAALIKETAGGRIAAGRIDAYSSRQEPAKIRLRWNQIPRMLGVDVPRDETRRILTALGIPVASLDDEGLDAVQPSWRPDLTREIDLVEEVARIWGYDRVPSVVRGIGVPREEPSEELALASDVRSWLVGLGLQETVTSSLVPPRDAEMVPTNGEPVKLANYSSADMSVMRTHMLPSLLEVARLNFAHRALGVAIFETGFVYARRADTGYREDHVVGMLLTGNVGGERWIDDGRQWDFYDVRGLVETIVTRCSLDLPEIVHYGGEEFAPHTGACILVAEDEVGHMGQVRREACDQYDLPAPVFFCQLDLERLTAHRRRVSRVKTLPRFPAAERDLALVVSDAVPAREVERIVQRAGEPSLESVAVFDVYRGAGLGDGERSLGFRLRFRAEDRTLTDAEVDARINDIVGAATEAVGARLRT